ncbi:MAG: flagellar hook-basal body protein [Verrucomicrobiota bacterium]
MIGGLQSAISGMAAQIARLDTAGNNIANAWTPAYKSKSVDLQSEGAQGVGLGVSVVGTKLNTSQGPLMRTDMPSDLAILGEGYFRVENSDGNTFYTRNGTFTKDADGYLRTGSGEYLLGDSGRVQIPANAANYSIAKDGTVTSVDSDGNVTTAGRINLATFGNEQGLVNLGNGLYTTSAASGSPTLAYPSDGAGTLESGAIEMSNVDYISDIVTMITAKAAFQANTATFKTATEMYDSLLKAIR